MARFYSATEIRELTLEAATEEGTTWDVFVSHTSGDDELADQVAECIRSYQLSAWVDSDHMTSHDDGPEMANNIKRVIRKSYCLLAIVTSATQESWWVPFEIGVASQLSRFLSTYGEHSTKLPSFLGTWPRVRGHEELHKWCDFISQKKATYFPSTGDGIIKIAGSQQSSYTVEMRAMARSFPGAR